MKIYDNGGKTIDRYTILIEPLYFRKDKMKKYLVEKMDKPFPITSVCREDVISGKGQKFAESLTDDEMNYVADVIGDGMMDGFWVDLAIAIEKIEEVRKKELLGLK